MPIHDQGYRRYGGDRGRREPAWAVIAKAGLRARLGQRAFVALLLASWLPFIVRVVQLYAAANLPQASFLAPTPLMFRHSNTDFELVIHRRDAASFRRHQSMSIIHRNDANNQFWPYTKVRYDRIHL